MDDQNECVLCKIITTINLPLYFENVFIKGNTVDKSAYSIEHTFAAAVRESIISHFQAHIQNTADNVK